jgi:hypothetical protein
MCRILEFHTDEAKAVPMDWRGRSKTASANQRFGLTR